MPRDWPETVETVLLDAGGVLLDLDYPYLKRLIGTRRDGHLPPISELELSRLEAVARREIHRQVEAGGRVSDAWRDYFHVILGHAGVPVGEQPALIDALWEAHQRFGLWTSPIDGAPETVSQLKRQGLTLGVVSNAEGRVARDLDAAGYEGLFGAVVDSHVVGVEKPDPEIFRIAMARLGAAPETTIHVGDVPAVDVEGARAAGVVPVLLDRHDLYPDADVRRIRSIRELPRLLQPR